MDKISQLAEMIKNAQNIVFFGGAGVSTESGIPDYRSENGMYATVKEYGVSPETILSHTFFERDPETFYKFHREYFLVSGIEPNRAHKALVRLEEMGKLRAVVTQNIDSLHQAAGSKNVFELHGSAARHYCTRCKKSYPVSCVGSSGVPHCEVCGAIIRPDITLYEEALCEKTVNGAVAAIAAADMLIVGGTSLAVYPAASFLHYFRGDNIVLINRGETPYDSIAKLVFRESIGEVLSKTMEKL